MALNQMNYRGLVFFPALIWFFACSEIYQRAVIELNGVVVSSQTSCVQPQNNRCATTYVVEGPDKSRTTYIAGPTDKALSRQLPVGTMIAKKKWALAYSINGQRINDFPSIFYGTLLVFGLCLVGWWYFLTRRVPN